MSDGNSIYQQLFQLLRFEIHISVNEKHKNILNNLNEKKIFHDFGKQQSSNKIYRTITIGLYIKYVDLFIRISNIRM